MYVLIAGDSDPDYSRVYGPFETAAEAYAKSPEDSDDTRWRALKIQPVADIPKDDDYLGEDNVGDTDEPADNATAAQKPDEASPQATPTLEEQMLALIREHGGLHDIPAPNTVVYQWSAWKLRRLGEGAFPLTDDQRELLMGKETPRQKNERERAAADNERERRIWRELRDAHQPVVAKPETAAPKKPRKPSAAQLAKQAQRELEQRVHALTQLYRGIEAIPAPNADVYAWVQAKLADMGEGGHALSKGIDEYYFGKAPNRLTGRALKQAQEALIKNRAEWYPLRDKHTPEG
jgi:hypothetical protein